MASTSPSPNSSPSAVPPTSTAFSPPSNISSPPPKPTIASPPPSTTLPNQTSEPPGTSTPSNSSAPPPQSPPPPAPGAPPPPPPPSSSQSPPPPSTPSSTSPPPSPPVSSPPTSSPPPSPATSTPPPLPSVSPPPSPHPAATSPPSSNSSAPPPSGGSSPPPQAPPTPPEVVSSSPPPANVPTPPSSSPPLPETKPPKSSPLAPALPPPPSDSHSASPPAIDSPPTSTLRSPPPSVPSTSSPPLPSPPAPTPPNLPSIPTQKPTAKPTTDGNVITNDTSNGGGLKIEGAVAIGIAVGFVVLSLIVIAVWFVQKQKKRSNRVNVGYGVPSPFTSSQNSESLFLRPYSPAPHVRSGSGFINSPPEQGGVSNSRSWFTYEELHQATKGFSTEKLLGEGGFGCVYKGVLTDGREVAVKQLKIGGGQGEREFRAEVEIISRVHHRHLVSLVGYCISEHQRLLVYEYVPNDTLHYHLHGEGRPVLDWSTRVKVAAGAARGIAYLHEDCHPRIIHRDIKSSNILLDSDFEARVADFGLAKLALDSNTHVTTRVMGTFGYMAPEYATSGKLTEKSDVYSFGVVLLELITGRKPVDSSQPMGDESLVEWARPLLAHAIDNEDFEGLIDPRLEMNYVAIEMFRMVEAAAACVRHSAAKRPKMSQVVRALESMDDNSDLSNGMKPGQSEIFDAQHSAQIRMFRRMAFGSQDYSTDFFNQTQSSSRSRESRDQSQSSWTSREHSNHQSRVIDINRSGM